MPLRHLWKIQKKQRCCFIRGRIKWWLSSESMVGVQVLLFAIRSWNIFQNRRAWNMIKEIKGEKMSGLEKKVFFICNIGTVISYWGIPYFWNKMNQASTSFMSELFWLPLLVLAFSVIFNLMFLWFLAKSFKKKQ